MKPLSSTFKIRILQSTFLAFVLLSAIGCAVSGVNTNIFTSGTTPLHPCGIAVGKLTQANTNALPDGPVAVSTYEGDPNLGLVYVWKSCRAFLSSAPITNSSGKLLNTPTTAPDYQITGITDPEGITFDDKGNLYITATSPTPTVIYYVNMTDLANAQPDPVTNIPTLTAATLKTIAISSNPINDPANPNDTYGQPRGLTYNTDDASLYAVMENYKHNGNNKSTVFQITSPTSNTKIYAVGNNLNVGNCLGIAYSKKHQCFYLTDLEQKLHQLAFPTGTKINATAGIALQEPVSPIILTGVYTMDVGVSADTTTQDSVYFTTTNALAPSGNLSNPNPECFLNSIAYSNWASYVNGTQTPLLTPIDAPNFGSSNFVAWGVGVFPYANTANVTSFQGVIVADAPKNKVVRFIFQ